MKRRIVFATGNPHKITEIKAVLGSDYELIGLEDIGCHEDIPETQPTIEGNALQKARYVVEHYGVKNCFAEDTGFEVEDLNGEPGIYSARYAGPERSAENNIKLVLKKLQNKENRTARFRTVVALILEGKEYTFEGIISGIVKKEKSGTGGFGYDPIFVPEGETRSFAEMSKEEKNKISHRARAVQQLKQFLETA